MPESQASETPTAETNSHPPPRSFWSGTISFGLVTVPVDFLPANRSSRLSLRMLAPDGTPLRRRYWCPKEERLVDDERIVRGYELEEQGEYVVVSDEELEALAPEKSREIDLRRFVDVESIDPIYFERAYFLAPGGDTDNAYRLLAQAMEESGRAGVGTFVMRGKQYVVAILAEDGILRAETMRFPDEVRTPETVGLPEEVPAEKKTVQRFAKAIDRLAAEELDPDELQDRHTKELVRLVERKASKGEDVVELPEAALEDEDQVIDILAVLKRRLAETEAGGDGKRKGPSRAGRPSRAGGEGLAERTKGELYEIAQDLDIPGRSRMTKDELIQAIGRSA